MEIYLPYDKLVNTEQLSEELNGVAVTLVDNKLRFVGDITEAQAEAALDVHTPQINPEPTIAEKLASVGLSVDDLKSALGL